MHQISRETYKFASINLSTCKNLSDMKIYINYLRLRQKKVYKSTLLIPISILLIDFMN